MPFVRFTPGGPSTIAKAQDLSADQQRDALEKCSELRNYPLFRERATEKGFKSDDLIEIKRDGTQYHVLLHHSPHDYGTEIDTDPKMIELARSILGGPIDPPKPVTPPVVTLPSPAKTTPVSDEHVVPPAERPAPDAPSYSVPPLTLTPHHSMPPFPALHLHPTAPSLGGMPLPDGNHLNAAAQSSSEMAPCGGMVMRPQQAGVADRPPADGLVEAVDSRLNDLLNRERAEKTSLQRQLAELTAQSAAAAARHENEFASFQRSYDAEIAQLHVERERLVQQMGSQARPAEETVIVELRQELQTNRERIAELMQQQDEMTRTAQEEIRKLRHELSVRTTADPHPQTVQTASRSPKQAERIAALEAELKEQAERAEAERLTLQRKVDATRALNERLKAQLADTEKKERAALEEADKDRTQAKEKLKQAERELAALRKMARELEERKQAAEDSLSAENIALRKKGEQSQSAVQDLQAKLERISQENAGLREKMKLLHAGLEEFERRQEKIAKLLGNAKKSSAKPAVTLQK